MFNFLKKKDKVLKKTKSNKNATVVLNCARTTSQWYKEYGRCLGGVDQYHRLSFLGIKFTGYDNELEELKKGFYLIHNITIMGNIIYGSIYNLNKLIYYCNIFKISNYIVLTLQEIISYVDANYACDRYGLYPYCDSSEKYITNNQYAKYMRIPMLFDIKDANKSLALDLSDDYVRTDKGIVVSLPLIPAISLSENIDDIKESIYKILEGSYDEEKEHDKSYDNAINELIKISTEENILNSIESVDVLI